jgi:hypothetical protein
MPLLGIMDLVLPEEAGPIITDFKTASKSSGPLEITHEIQLSCYAYLLRHYRRSRKPAWRFVAWSKPNSRRCCSIGIRGEQNSISAGCLL